MRDAEVEDQAPAASLVSHVVPKGGTSAAGTGYFYYCGLPSKSKET